MNIQKINALLTNGMIGTFVSIILFTLLSLFLPIMSYVVGIGIYILMIVTFFNFLLTTYLLVKQMNKMIEEFIHAYEQSH